MPSWPEFAEWADSISLLTAILWTAGVIAVIAFLWWFRKYGWPWLVAFARAIIKTAQVVDAVQALPEFITRTDKGIAQIKHEVLPNNGGSLRDRVEQQGQQLNEQSAELKDINGKLDRDHRRINDIEKTLTPMQLEQLREDLRTYPTDTSEE